MEFVHDTQEYILKEYFPHIFYQFGPMTSSWPRKTAVFDHFEQFLADFSLLLNYNMVITAYNHGGDCS